MTLVIEDGTLYWLNNKEKPHREDGPAIIYPNGTREWFLNGRRHREDGPARIYPEGRREWWVNGQLHREDGPAFIKPGWEISWYLGGVCHREDGPALTYFRYGRLLAEEWWEHGERKWMVDYSLSTVYTCNRKTHY